jgi:hypothetical protein
MKLLLLIIALLFTINSFSQIDENEYVKRQLSFDIAGKTDNVIKILKDQKKDSIFNYLKAEIAAVPTGTDLKDLSEYLTTAGKGLFDRVSNGDNAAIIVVYRNMRKYKDPTDNSLKYGIDAESLNSIIYHQKKIINRKTKKAEMVWNNYLLGTKEVTLIYVDFNDTYYSDVPDDADKQLSNTIVKIVYHTPFSKQTAKDLLALAKGVGAMSPNGDKTSTPDIRITIVQIESKKIKDPCDIVLANKGFTKNLEFNIHDLNFSSFQAGLINSQLRVNNFSIASGNLIITPDATQKEEWKSKLFASFEFHPIGYNAQFGRDIENFAPLWQDIFRSKKLDKIGFWPWLRQITFSRIGIYGGLKIDKDPLSSLHAGLNFAVTKTLYLNFGSTWTNEIVPQVKSIGNITSINDAKAYAKRKYSGPTYSWGVSFAPSTVIEMLGLKKQD